MELRYETRDGKGKEIVKMIQVKEYPVEAVEYTCPICHKLKQEGISIKKIVSSNFTDWAYVGEYVCTECSKLFSLYFYSYIVDPDGIRLLNVRQLKEELCKRQTPPFRFIITTYDYPYIDRCINRNEITMLYNDAIIRNGMMWHYTKMYPDFFEWLESRYGNIGM